MSILDDYRGLQVVTPDPTEAGGLAINNDFKALADWHPKSVWDQSADPGVTDDIDSDFYVGSLWYRSDNGVLFICSDNSVGNAVWKLLLVQPKTDKPLQADIGGNARGDNATDWQRDRGADTHVASGDGAVIGGGGLNQAPGDGSLVGGGRNNITSGDYATIPGGRNARAIGDYSTAMGLNTKAELPGQLAMAHGHFIAYGDAQASWLVARNTTIGTASAELFLDGSSEQLVLPDDKTWAFSGLLVARQTDAGTTNSAGWEFKGVIENFGGTVAMAGAATVTSIGDDSGGVWTLAVSADDTNNALKLLVTGEDKKTIRWVAKVSLAEVEG